MGDQRIELPAGYVFSPSNEDIFKFYLKPLIEGQKDDYLNPIYKTDELYGENVNIDLTFERALRNYTHYVNAEKIYDDSLWLFTKLKRHGTSNRFDRKAGAGTWTGIDPAKTKYEDNKEFLKGKFRTFAFTVPDNDGGLQGNSTKAPKRKRISASASRDLNNNANWIMHEYSLEKDGKLYSDYVIVKIRRKRNTSSCSQEVQNEAAVEVEDGRATKTPPIAYQYQLPSSDSQHDTAPPTQDDQQGEYSCDLDVDSLMAELEESGDEVRQAEIEGSMDEPVSDVYVRAIEGDNAADQYHYQQGTNETLVTNLEVEAVQPQEEVSDDDFFADLDFTFDDFLM